jgi:hypothetical protein
MPLSTINSNSFSTTANTNIDNGNLFIDAINNRIGMGTTGPAQKLDVSGVIQTLTTLQSSSGADLTLNANGANRDVFLKVNGTTIATAVGSTSNFQFNSGYGSVATAYGVRAWVNFNGSGTVAIRSSGNVSSITDNAIGSYTVNLTTAMPDVNFGVFISSDTNTSGGINADFSGIISTSAVYAYTYSIAGGGAGAYRDTASIWVSIVR